MQQLTIWLSIDVSHPWQTQTTHIRECMIGQLTIGLSITRLKLQAHTCLVTRFLAANLLLAAFLSLARMRTAAAAGSSSFQTCVLLMLVG